MHFLSSPDDSSVDPLEQSSSYASFCSTQSHLSQANSDSSMAPPNSIFLDDISCRNFMAHDPNTAFHAEDSTEDQFSAIEVDDVDHLFNYPEMPYDEMSSSSTDHDSVLESTLPSLWHNTDDKGHSRYCRHNHFEEMTRDEIASYKIMSLLDAAGAPRICYNRLMALLKKLSKHHGFDVKKAVNRETLMKRLEGRYQTRPSIQSTILNSEATGSVQIYIPGCASRLDLHLE